MAEGVSGDKLKAAAYLHDSLEDTKLTAEDLQKLGVESSVIHLVEQLTRKPGESYQEYIDRISKDPDASQIKLADLRHNSDLSRIPFPVDEDRQRRKKYQRSICYLENVLESHKNNA
ncbi:GTP pyrophosphokinase [uncultured Faecalibaculum sp.]|uniref:GTP pyrophosphokinase n=1 Tax=uncultured Faecalibaculum sp. TaxID=1729681 RepID=UPI0025D7336A|nr:GTP pyrophosphokinase [uncultured Faecalibaculum sp.]